MQYVMDPKLVHIIESCDFQVNKRLEEALRIGGGLRIGIALWNELAKPFVQKALGVIGIGYGGVYTYKHIAKPEVTAFYDEKAERAKAITEQGKKDIMTRWDKFNEWITRLSGMSPSELGTKLGHKLTEFRQFIMDFIVKFVNGICHIVWITLASLGGLFAAIVPGGESINKMIAWLSPYVQFAIKSTTYIGGAMGIIYLLYKFAQLFKKKTGEEAKEVIKDTAHQAMSMAERNVKPENKEKLQKIKNKSERLGGI